jgi:general secretion pathway protein G
MLEMILVLSIFAVVVGMGVPIASMAVTRDRVDATRQQLQTLEPAVEAYFQDTWQFPPTFDDLQANVSAVAGWNGPYMAAISSGHAGQNLSLTADAWGNAYTVTVVNASQITVKSRGPDRVANTADDVTLTIDVTPRRRRQTVDELATLNAAIASYNATHLPDAPLAPPLATMLATLSSSGYLPATYSAYLTDGWGDAYVEYPAGATPVVMLISNHLGDAGRH